MRRTARAGARCAGLPAASGGAALACAPATSGASLTLALLCLVAAAAVVLVARSRSRRAAASDRALAAERQVRRAAEGRLRAAATAAPADADAHHAPEPVRGRILVIDDDADVARILIRALEPEHEVEAETDPERALVRLRAGEDFDVVFCDVVMPTLDGLSVHDATGTLRPAQAERFVFLTGAGRSGSASIASVGRLVIEKPFDLDAVRALARARVRAVRQPRGAASGRADGDE
jgi:CheY-like chemotaxis protein